MMATRGAVLPLWGIILEQSLASSGSKLEWPVHSHTDLGGSWRRGAAEARRRVRVVLRALGGGIVWYHGGVDGKHGKRLFFGLIPW
jgi:hypothetical protein